MKLEIYNYAGRPPTMLNRISIARRGWYGRTPSWPLPGFFVFFWFLRHTCVIHYTDVARLWVRHSDMLSRGWNVNMRPKAECDIPTEGQHIWMSHKQSCDICFVVWPTLSIFFCHWRKRESLSSAIYDINAHTSSYRLRLSVRVNWSDTARQMLYTRPAVTWIRVELRTQPNSNPNPNTDPNPNPNRVHSQILNKRQTAGRVYRHFVIAYFFTYEGSHQMSGEIRTKNNECSNKVPYVINLWITLSFAWWKWIQFWKFIVDMLLRCHVPRVVKGTVTRLYLCIWSISVVVCTGKNLYNNEHVAIKLVSCAPFSY